MPVPSASLSDAISAFQIGWISHFWAPFAVQGDLDFRHLEFTEYVIQYSI